MGRCKQKQRRLRGLLCRWPSITEWEMHITAQSPHLRNDLYCVEWDVLNSSIPYHTCDVTEMLLVAVCAECAVIFYYCPNFPAKCMLKSKYVQCTDGNQAGNCFRKTVYCQPTVSCGIANEVKDVCGKIFLLFFVD